MRNSACIASIIAALAFASSANLHDAFGAPPPPPRPSSPADVKKAQGLFKKADELYAAKKFAEAIVLFRDSYATVPSPNSHLYIARCMAQMGDQRAAYLEFQKVFEEAESRAGGEPKYAPTRDSARVERDEVGNKLAMVTVNVSHADASTTVRIGDVDVSQAEWGKPIPINVGAVDVTLQSGGRVIRSNMNLAAGDKKDLQLDTQQNAPPPVVAQPATEETAPSNGNKTLRYAGIAVAGVGLVGIGVFAITGSMEKSKFNTLNDKCNGGPCPASLQNDVSSGKTLQTVANISLIAGAVAVAGGATMIVLSFRNSPAPAETTGAQTRFVVGPAYAGLSGSF